MAVTQKVTLYNNKFTVPPVINAVQNDTDRQVEAYFGDFTLQVGMTGKLSFIRSDGTHYEVSATLNTGANTATAELDQALTQAGVTQAQLKITDSGNVGSTFTFMIKVQPDVAGISQQQDGYSAEELAQGIADNASAIANIENVELPKKADSDGNYEDMTVGTADSVLGSSTTESVPYLFRRSASIGVRESDKIIGGTVAWNQLVPDGTASSSLYTVSFSVDSNNVWSVTGTPNDTGWITNNAKKVSFIKDHIYAVVLQNPITTGAWIQWSMVGGFTNINGSTVRKAGATGDGSLQIRLANGTAWSWSSHVIVTDLTQALGSAIADYIYGLESGTAGSGIAKLKEWGFLTKDYYEYDSGSLQSVKTSAHIMRDAYDNIIGDYPLDSSLELRGIPKLDGSNKLYYDGDSYASDGTVTRRYGIVDLGSLNWDYSNSRFQSTGINSTAKTYADNVMPHIVCSRYTTFKPSETGSTALGITLFESNGTKYIRVIDPTYTDKNTFKTAMNGVYLVYELATPTTETADSFHDPQICSPYGTEEYVDTRDVPVPVGHETEYYADPVAEIERVAVQVPVPPSANGTYRLTCVVSGGVPTYSWTS